MRTQKLLNERTGGKPNSTSTVESERARRAKRALPHLSTSSSLFSPHRLFFPPSASASPLHKNKKQQRTPTTKKMTYAGYVPAKIASVKTPLQVALAALESEAALELLTTLCRNAACAPSEPKYRRVRATNSRVTAACAACGEETFTNAMEALGWSKKAVEGEEGEFFVLAAGKGTTAQVREIQDVIAEFKRSSRVKTVRSISSRSNLTAGVEENEDAKRIKEQMRADAAERATAAPVTTGSKAQPLPGAVGSKENGGGPRVAGCSDVGIGSG